MARRQIARVHVSFRLVQPVLDAAAAMFYDRLFELGPSLRRLCQRAFHPLVIDFAVALRPLG